MIFPRKIQERLTKCIDEPEIVVLTGMRRVGKTTLYQSIFRSIESKNKAFFDLENPIVQKVFEEIDYNNIILNLKEYGIVSKEKAYIFLDEIQAMPNIVKVVKYLYDHFGVKFFLTGSSSFYLKNLFPESLSGRKFVFNLYPLNFEEFLIFKGIEREVLGDFSQKDRRKNFIRYQRLKALYEEYLNYGGFPQVVLEEDITRKGMHLNDIFKSYFEKDVKNLARFREIQLFRDLLLLLFSRVGSKLDIARLASELGTSRETIYSYLSFLQDTFFITLVPSFTGSMDKLVSKAKKVYFCDTGILNEFAKVSEGALFENAVYNNLQGFNNIHYYQKRSGREIDFILDSKIGLEVKLKGIPSDFERLKTISAKIGLKNCYVVSKEFVDSDGFISVIDL
ncbi:MAG: ATP-binding protein [bacterium]